MAELIELIGGGNLVMILLGGLILLTISKGLRIVPQSEKHVVERLGRLLKVMGPGMNFVVPYLDVVKHRVSVLERQLPTMRQDAITADNVLLQIDTSVFYRVIQPERTVYRIRDIDAAISTTVAGIVRSAIGEIELDEVQTNRARLITQLRQALEAVVDEWGIEVTRTEILDVNLDEATREAMLQQLNAERARRAQVTEAEGAKRAQELKAEAELYAAKKAAEARRVSADAEAYGTMVVAEAIEANGLEAAQYQIALKQVEAIAKMADGEGKQTLIVPADALESFSNAFKLLKGRG